MANASEKEGKVAAVAGGIGVVSGLGWKEAGSGTLSESWPPKAGNTDH